MSYRMINGRAYQVGNTIQMPAQRTKHSDKNVKSSFKDILNQTINEKKRGYILSKHAQERLEAINFSENDMRALEKGFRIAESKGSKNSVMLYKDIALITSIENKTVITAVDKERAKDNIFTNVDSVVIL